MGEKRKKAEKVGEEAAKMLLKNYHAKVPDISPFHEVYQRFFLRRHTAISIPIGIFDRKKSKSPAPGFFPYRDFLKKTQSPQYRAQHPYRDFSVKTQSPHHRAQHPYRELFLENLRVSTTGAPHTGKKT